MVDSGSIQKKMNDMQNSSNFSDLFGQLVSGRKGYKAVIEVSHPAPKCSKCSKVLEGVEKFCPECGQQTSFKK